MDISHDVNINTEAKQSNNDSELTYMELKSCNENLPGDLCITDSNSDEVNQINNFVSNESETNCDDSEEYGESFGDDWLGKPGVSSESENDEFSKECNILELKKIVKCMPVPSHILTIAGNPVTYKCSICVKTFGNKGHVRYHAYCDQSTKPYSCHLCPRSFSKKTVLNYHVKTHTGEKPYVCATCDKKFLQLDKLKRHKTIHLGKYLECNECNAKFRDTYSLNFHKKGHVKNNFYIFKCDSCDKCFKDKSTLNKHNKGVHSRTIKYVCEHCGKAFDWKYNLVCHIRTHFGVRAFACNQCNRTFKNQNDCHKHKLTHTDLREYMCNVCDAAFKRRDNLVRHLRNIHPEQDPKKISKVQTGMPQSPLITSNRISVIKNVTSSPVSEHTQQSVIRHSGSSFQISHNEVFLSPSHCIRECVIKSTL